MKTSENLSLVHGDSLTLTYRTGESPAIDSISISLDAGELCGLIGPNGAGKTTLISILTTLLNPDSGSLTICGRDALSQAGLIRRQLGVVPQELALYDRLSGLENLLYFGRLYGLSDRQVKEKSGYFLNMFGLEDKAGSQVSTYSGGMKRRINLIIGLLHDPLVLFLDEPTAGVDAQSRHLIIEKLRLLNSGGMAMIYTSHYLEEIQELCSRVVIINKGRKVAEGSPEELVGEAESFSNLADFYLHTTGEKLPN